MCAIHCTQKNSLTLTHSVDISKHRKCHKSQFVILTAVLAWHYETVIFVTVDLWILLYVYMMYKMAYLIVTVSTGISHDNAQWGENRLRLKTYHILSLIRILCMCAWGTDKNLEGERKNFAKKRQNI